MASFGPHTRSFDGSMAGPPGSRPRVYLPQAPAGMNLSQLPAHWTAAPTNRQYQLSAAPDTVSLDQSFPSLGLSQPRVNIPSNPPLHARYPSNVSQSSPNAFEDRVRGMILSNDTQQQATSSNQAGFKRPNQAQRRQQIVPLGPSTPAHRAPQRQDSQPVLNHQANTQAKVAPHLRDPSQSANDWRQNSTYVPPNTVVRGQTQNYYRPPPQHRQLYNPASNGTKPNLGSHHLAASVVANEYAQAAYLDVIALEEIPRAAITVEEFDEKQRLRKTLEQACQKAVCEYEKKQNGVDFGTESVQLKCFGSLSTTFATKASDMDLVLLSPLSRPNAASPDSELPRLIEKTLLDSGYGVRLLTKTRVPIIKFCEKPTSELLALLLAEREKFEKERRSPMPPKVTKVAKKVRKPTIEKSPDSTLPQNRPNSVTEVVLRPNSRDISSDGKVGQAVIANRADSDGKPASPVDDEEQPNKPLNNHEDKSPNPMKTEGDDPSLSTKSDSERIRLYKLAIGEGWYTASERKIISNFFQAFVGHDTSENAKNLARDSLKDLPNVIGRYREPPEHHLDFPKHGVGIQCDINFSNHLALHNSHMLKCYSLCDPRVRKMVIFVKAWSKRRKINTPYHGTLSSYGYVLMVLHYLINIAQPPVLPNLQRIPLAFEDEVSARVVELDGYNVQFLRNEAVIEDLLKQKKITFNTESVGSLLRGFFQYYAHTDRRSPFGGFQWGMDALSLRTVGGIIPKQAKGWTGAKTDTVELKGPGPQQVKEIRQRYLFAIEDPFELEHNVARTVVHNGIVAIRDEFRRAHRLIEHAGVLPRKGSEDLFAEGEDKENLQRSLFGPRPRNGPDRKGNGRPNAGNGNGVAPNAAPVK